ncbi:MAG: hypothetical protein C0613_06595 [Desulfobulbaceae bacterium]|nr:MAG: hypothetical protein C0613_06595 [Desulfobulbaceae bacterium]
MEASHKTVVSRDKEIGEMAEKPSGPVGLDIGTSHIVMAQNAGRHINTVNQLNAFFTIPYSKFTKKILVENDITFYAKEDQFYILGYSAENFANMFNTNTRRTMEKGILSSHEDEGITVLQSIISSLLAKTDQQEVVCFSMPGEPVDGKASVVYHESIIKMYLASLGYRPISINEGLATIMSELADDNFTGIGISMGGGMCNICLSYLSVPVLSFSIQRGGDYIDSMVGASVGEPATRIKMIKEGSLNLARSPQDRVETALDIYYVDLVSHLLGTLEHELRTTDKMPNINNALPIVLSGGTVLPKGFQDLFEKGLRKVNMPLEISEVRIASDPLNTTAKGAMVMALSEEI